MTTGKKLGIWMDHSNAHLIEFTTDSNETESIAGKFTNDTKEHGSGRNENQMNNKVQQHQSEYYKKLGEVIKNYEEVILFGPTDAKAELFNVLKADNNFEKVKIEVEQGDKMSENQQHAFVRDYFSKN